MGTWVGAAYPEDLELETVSDTAADTEAEDPAEDNALDALARVDDAAADADFCSSVWAPLGLAGGEYETHALDTRCRAAKRRCHGARNAH